MDASALPNVPDALFDAFSPVSTDAWERKIREDLQGQDPDTVLVWDSLDGVASHAFYRAADRDGLPHMRAVPLADSAAAPARSWRLRQDVLSSDLATARHQVHAALDGGATDIGIAPRQDAATTPNGLIQRKSDLDALLSDVDLAATPIHCAGGPVGLARWAMLCAVAAERGTPRAALAGSTDFDPVAALAHHRMARPDRAFDAAADAVRFATAASAPARLLSVDLRPYHAAGASAVQELAFALGACSELLAQLRTRGCAPAAVARTLQWMAPVGTSYFIAIAKLRALRLLIPQVLAPFGVETTPSAPLVQAVTAARTATVYGQHVNLLRSTTAAAAAVIGGCDILSVRPFPAAAEPPDDFALRMARNTQLILRDEAHLDHVADPAAGAYYVEVMTDRLARGAWSLFQALEADGGLLDALRAGTVQQQIAEVRTERMDRVASRERVLVGTNHYPNLDERHPPSASPASASPPEEQPGRTPPIPAEASLAALQEAFSDGAPLGDAVGALRRAGSPSFDALPLLRLAAPFEALRQRTDAWAARHDGPPRAALLPLGDPAARSARATFARNVLGVAGFAIDEHVGFETADEAAQAAADAAADLVVLCSTDDAYAALVPAVCDALAERALHPIVVVAGAVPDQRAALEDAGADAFIHRDRPLLNTLTDLQQRLGIR